MSMRIDAFKQALRDGGARPNLFEVTGSFPGGNTRGGSLDNMKFLIKAASIPQATVGLIEVPYRGRQLKIAGDRTFDSWSITVINTNDFEIRNAFEAWSELMNGNITNESARTLDDYFQDWTVKQLDRDGTVSETYTFSGCYPESVGPIELSHESNNQLEYFEVTLQYQYWIHAGITNR